MTRPLLLGASAHIWLASALTAQSPSPSVRFGAACENAPDAVEGVVIDLLTEAGIPGAAVTVRAGNGVFVVGETDAAGYFTVCGLSGTAGPSIEATIGAASSGPRPLPSAEPLAPIYIEWTVPLSIAGVVVDAATDQPLEGAVVSLPDRGTRTTTDDSGRFRLDGQGAGTLTVRAEHLGYLTRTDDFRASSGDQVDVTIALSTEPIELDPIEVVVRSMEGREERALASRIDALSEVQIDSILPRVIDFAALMRSARFPGLRIQVDGGRGTICITRVRAGLGCDMVEVFLDGARMGNPQSVLASLDPNIVSSIRYLDPFEASGRYTGPNVPNGVLLIQTRGGRRR